MKPRAVRVPLGGRLDIQVSIGRKDEAGGAGAFWFDTRAGDRPPERVACRVRYTFDRYAE